MTAIGLRPATAADSTVCYLLHRAAMPTCIEAIWGWDEQTQQPSTKAASNRPEPGS